MSKLSRMEEDARKIGELIGRALPKGTGFCLMVFDFGPEGWSTYVSNAQPADMIKALRELADKREAMLNEEGR